MADYKGSITLAAVSDGQSGATGPTGIGVSNILEQYAITVSSSSTPPSSAWSSSYTWEDGKYVWTRSKITWTDGNTTYTDPILASGINSANETAVAASTTADSAYSYAGTVASDLSALSSSVTSSINALWNQVDGQIEAWYQSTDPTTSNYPASTWTNDTERDRHLGDLYYNIENGHAWRWLKEGNTYKWQQIPDGDAAEALAKATEAEDLAESKRRIFVSQPSGPYEVGDLWVNGSVVKYCNVARTSGFESSEWTLTATDDSAANAAMAAANAAQSSANIIIQTALTSVDVYYAQNASATVAPTTGWSTSPPTWEDGKYIWSKTIKVVNGQSSETDPVNVTGAKGETGASGAPAPIISLEGSTNVIAYDVNTSTYTPSSAFTVTGTATNTTIATWSYSVNGGSWSATAPAGLSRSNNVVTVTPGSFTNKVVGIKAFNGTAEDVFTITKVTNGQNGATGPSGPQGPAGADAVEIILTNEAHTIAADWEGTVPSSSLTGAYTDVLVYQGITNVTSQYTLSAVASPSTGIGFTISGNRITVNSVSGIDNGTITATMSKSGTSLSKVFTLTIAKGGRDGDEITYDFVTSREAVYKFINKNGSTSTYEYSPSSFTYTLQKLENGVATNLTPGTHYTDKLEVVGKESDFGDLWTLFAAVGATSTARSVNGAVVTFKIQDVLNFTPTSGTTDNKTKFANFKEYVKEANTAFAIKAYTTGNNPLQMPAVRTVNFVFGTDANMASFRTTASSIQAAVDSSKLIFDANGLTVQNGGIQVLSSSSEVLLGYNSSGGLYVKGDGEFTGTITATSGSIGGMNVTSSMLKMNTIVLEPGKGIYSTNNVSGTSTPVFLISDGDGSSTFYSINAKSGTLGTLTAEDTITVGAPGKAGLIKSYNYSANAAGWAISSTGEAEFNNIKANGGSLKNLSVNGTLTLNSGGLIKSGNYSSGSTGWSISSTGAAEFNNVTARGTIYASAGTLGNMTVASTLTVGAPGSAGVIKSYGYSAGSTGWAINSNGSAEFNNISANGGTLKTLGVTGTLTLNSGGVIKSANYSDTNGTGWSISSSGDAVFNNVSVRGSIKTAVFEYSEVQAVGGIFLFRPSSVIKTATTSSTNLIVTVEHPELFSVGDWCKIGTSTAYRISTKGSDNKLTLAGAASEVTAAAAVGAGLISLGNTSTASTTTTTDNYGIGINSSDSAVTLPPRAISLFESAVNPSGNPKVTYNYRGVLGTLPSGLVGSGSIYDSYLKGTQGIFTDNMYIGDADKYVAFYTDNGTKKLRISGADVVFAANSDENIGHFIYNASTIGSTNPGANVVETIAAAPSGWGYNTHIGATGILLRQGENVLSSWSSSALNFYYPGTSHAALALGGNTLTFYAGDGTTPQATFGGTGAEISGSVKAYNMHIGYSNSNYWYIGNSTDYYQGDSAIIKAYGTASIQLASSSTWRLATNRIHTAWNIEDSSSQYNHLLNFPQYTDSSNASRHWDMGAHYPTSRTDKFLYLRRSINNATITNLNDDLDNDSSSYWRYSFYVSGDGNLYARNLYVLDDDGNATIISGTEAPYLLKSGGTMTGSITMATNSYFIGNLQGNASSATSATTASKLSNTAAIGGATQPVYFTASGVPSAISYTIAKSVPSTAVFTDQNVQTTNANTTKLFITGATGTTTGALKYDTGVYLTTTSGVLHATTFEGDLSGTASRATADGDGNTIKTTYFKISGGTITGPVIFGDSVTMDDATVGSLVVSGSQTITNGLQVNTINGVTVGSSPKFTDTNYYHTTGSWGGTNSLTYTATANGGAGALAFTLPTATTGAYGVVQLTNAVNSTSTTLAATASAVKAAYDLAASKTSNTGTVTSVAASGSGGISISGSPITTSGTIAIGLNLSTAINGLGEGSSPAQRDDYIVAQYAGGGTTTTTYHRRKLSNIFAALNSSDITTALGYTPYNSTNPNGYTTNTGTVTSVRVQASSPLTSSASAASSTTLNTTIGFANQSANLVLAGPSSGSAAAPTFRSLVAADIPTITKSKISDFPTSLKNPNSLEIKVYSGSNSPSTVTYDGSTSGQSASVAGTAAITGISASAASGGSTTFTLTKANGTTSTFDVTVTASVATGATKLTDASGTGISKGSASTPVYFTGGSPDAVTSIAYSLLPTGTTASTVAIGNHSHGNITSDGKITSTATIASGDKLVIVDSDSTSASKLTGSSITFGSTTTSFLANDGTWRTPGGTYSLPLAANGTRGGVQIGFTTDAANKNYAVQLSSEKMYVNVPWTNTTYSAGTGLSLSGTTFNHSNSITAGTAGTSSATTSTDGTISIPYVTYDAQGHITAKGTHTHTLTSYPEAYLSWGGKNFSGSYGPIDAAMIGMLGSNRLECLKDLEGKGIEVLYSTDGSTWTDYGLTSAQKRTIFTSCYGYSVTIGKRASADTKTVNDRARVIIHTQYNSLYTVLNKFAIYLSTSGSGACWVSIDKCIQNNDPTVESNWVNVVNKVTISGWSGWNIINTSGITTYGNTASSQYGHIRFTFGADTAGGTTYPGLTITKIMGFGGQGWSNPSNLAAYGHIYTWNYASDVVFPAYVSATQFIGPLNGTATKATADASGNTITSTYLKLSGGSMSGVLTAQGNVYTDSYTGALNMNNSNIYGVNSIYTADASDNSQEGIHFYRSATTVDTIHAASGNFYFTPNRTLGQAGTSYKVYHEGNKPTKSDVGLGNVENTALSTWAGSTNITTLGTISSGTWSATTIALNKGGTGAITAANARANLGTWSLVSDSYNTLMPADGTTNAWIKIGTSNTSYGLLPSASGGAGSGHNYIGTSSWYWKYAYIDQIYGYLNGNISGNAATTTTTADTTNALYPVGVTSGATTTLKRDTDIALQGGKITLSAKAAMSYNATLDALVFSFV